MQGNNPDLNRTGVDLTLIEATVLDTEMPDNKDEVSITRIMFHRYSLVYGELVTSYSQDMEITLPDPAHCVVAKVVNLTV